MRVGGELALVVRARGLALAAGVWGCAYVAARSGATGPTSSRATPAGSWQGEVRDPGYAPELIGINLDSAGGLWHGTAVSGSDTIRFASVTWQRDSIVLRLPPSAQDAILRGRLSADGRRIEGSYEPGDGVTFTAARVGTQDAAKFTTEAARVVASRRLAGSVPEVPAAVPRADPDSARLVTSDIQLFWDAVDKAPPDSLASYLQREYLDHGSVGVKDFIRGRILSAEDLAAMVRDRRALYDSVRAAHVDIARADSGIRAAFRRLKAIYPAAVFPDVYFVVGRFNSGGTASKHGLLIGAEMYRDAGALPAIVSHELIHFQQHYPNPTLLEHSFMEGSADFVGELICGAPINPAAHQYGLAHEHALWEEFRAHLADTAFFPWMYGKPPDGRPNDLGYFIGYRIAQAYYNRMADKQQAIRDIITGGEGRVEQLLETSGYNP